MDRDARRHLAKLSDGDARKCLNALEIGVLTTPAERASTVRVVREKGSEVRSPYHSLHDRGCRGKHPAEGRCLRSCRRRSLRYHQRVHQKHARFG